MTLPASNHCRGLLVGYGSIGKRHLANLRHLLPGAHLTLLRHRRRAQEDHQIPIERVVYRIEEALDDPPHFAVIASPAPFHIPTAIALARRGVHLLIEKPLSHNLEGVDELIDLCANHQLALLVGYTLRFSASLQILRKALHAEEIGQPYSFRAEVGQHLAHWRDSDYRTGPSANRALGGGALLELSHELDYVRWLMGEPISVFAHAAKVSDLEMDVEDHVEATALFGRDFSQQDFSQQDASPPIVGSIHLDMVASSGVRRCRILGERGVLEWDFLADTVRCFASDSSRWRDLWRCESPDRNTMYVAQMRHFLSCVYEGATVEVSGEDGKRTLQFLMAARHSIETRAFVDLPRLDDGKKRPQAAIGVGEPVVAVG